MGQCHGNKHVLTWGSKVWTQSIGPSLTHSGQAAIENSIRVILETLVWTALAAIERGDTPHFANLPHFPSSFATFSNILTLPLRKPETLSSFSPPFPYQYLPAPSSHSLAHYGACATLPISLPFFFEHVSIISSISLCLFDFIIKLSRVYYFASGFDCLMSLLQGDTPPPRRRDRYCSKRWFVCFASYSFYFFGMSSWVCIG